jgi:hypothetical protein
MSTFAAKMSVGSTKFQVAVASVAVVAAATLTPAVVHAAPSIAPISQSVTSVSSLIDTYELATTNDSSTAAAETTTAGPIESFVTAIVQGVATLVYVGLSFVGEIITLSANFVNGVATWVAQTFHVGPYATSE